MDLKPCPFCGAYAKLRGGPMAQETYSVWCVGPSLHHLDTLGYDEAEAIAAWNTRADLAPDPLRAVKVRALVEKAQALLDLNDNYSPFGGEIYRDRVDRTWDEFRAALAAFDKGGKDE